MEFKGNTAPWHIDNDTNQLVITNSDETKAVAFIPKVSDNSKSDSVLIAHAPEMLKMLKDILLGMKGENFEVTQNEIEQLIKSATEIK